MDLHFFINLFPTLFPLLLFLFLSFLLRYFISFFRHLIFSSSLLDEEEVKGVEEEKEIELKYNNINDNTDYSSNYNDLSFNDDNPIIYYRK